MYWSSSKRRTTMWGLHLTMSLSCCFLGQMPFFEEHDLEAMFAAFDVTDKGFITPKQYEQGTLLHPACLK